MTGLRWDIEWRTALLTALLLPTLVALGFWQLDRADEKALIAATNEQRAAAAPSSLDQLRRLEAEALAYRRTEVSGYFHPDVLIFLDNQIRDGRYGHDVLSVFIDRRSGLAALLNRGWVPGDPSRRSLPQVDTPDSPQTLSASVYVPPGEPYLLARERFDQVEWPVLVQDANGHALREAVEEATGLTLFPRELRLDVSAPAGFRRDWPVVNVSPQKHQGYALQWFTMAVVLLLFFIFRSSNLMGLIRGTKSASDKEQ